MNQNISKAEKLDLSLVIPAYNEEKNILPLYEKIISALKSLKKSYEIIFLDDGSNDNTFQEIQQLQKSDDRVFCIQLRRNFGKTIALTVGFKAACGEIVVTLDADLQDDPAEIPGFIERINEGWDVVSGWKKIRKDRLEKRMASRMFNFIVSLVSGLKLHDFNCGFKAYRNKVIKTIKIYSELHRFIPVIAFSYGFKVCEIPISHQRRQFGKTKYGKERYLNGFCDLFTTIFITQYLRKPLYLLGRVSLVTFIGGFILMIYVAVMKFVFGQTGNRPSLIISVFLLGLSVQILLFGFLADLLSLMHQKEGFMEEDFINKKIP